MCGRYRLKDPKAAFDWMEVSSAIDFLPRFNIAPSQRIAVVTAPGKIGAMAWGIPPAWAKEKSKALINARVETIREKRLFKSAFGKRRCLVPADGFYEWSRIGKHPWLFTFNGGAPFAIGGIWEPAGEDGQCCLLTTAGNAVLEPIHHRMPVIVPRADWEEWCSGEELAEEGFQRIAAPSPAEEMNAMQVSPLVNSARVDSPECCEPARNDEPLKITRKSDPARTGPKADPAQQTFLF